MELKSFNKAMFCDFILSEDLLGGIEYLKNLDDLSLYEEYINLFNNKKLKIVFNNDYLDGIFKIYQLYYIECFYEKISHEVALKNIIERFKIFFNIKHNIENFYEIEEVQISNAFKEAGYYFLGGRTSGYIGPYIWSNSELKEYDVEIRTLNTKFTVRFNSDFKSLSWMDFISNGLIGPGGWADADGTITCVKENWDLESDEFKISLLKHEAQHQADYIKYGIDSLTSEELEYRAKLIELIYFNNKKKFNSIISEANDKLINSGHALASNKIKNEFKKLVKVQFSDLNLNEIKKISTELFDKNTIELNTKYNQIDI